MSNYLYLSGRGVKKVYGPVDDKTLPDARKSFYLHGYSTTIIPKPPHERTMRKWKAKGFMKALDGCVVTGCSSCLHGKWSWAYVFEQVKKSKVKTNARRAS